MLESKIPLVPEVVGSFDVPNENDAFNADAELAVSIVSGLVGDGHASL